MNINLNDYPHFHSLFSNSKWKHSHFSHLVVDHVKGMPPFQQKKLCSLEETKTFPMAKCLNSLLSTFLVLLLGLTGTMMKLSGELQFHLVTALKGLTFIFFPCWNEDKLIQYFNRI